MITQQSPGVLITEIAANTTVVGTSTTGAILAGPFTWGPANVRTPVDSVDTYKSIFWEPDNDTANTWFTGSTFLAYGNNLNVIRVLPKLARNAAVVFDGISDVEIGANYGYFHTPTIATATSSGASFNAEIANGEIVGVSVTAPAGGFDVDNPPTLVVTPTGGDTPIVPAVLKAVVGIQINNPTDYSANFAGGQMTAAGEFCAKYAGTLGNGIQIAICDSAVQFATWAYKGYFTGPPGTSAYVAALGGSNDQLHIVLLDNLGIITGYPGSVLETYPFVSKASDAQNAQGQSIYYPQVLQSQSKWIYWLDFPATMINWGSTGRGTTFDTLYVAATPSALSSGTGASKEIYTAVTPGNLTPPVTVNITANGTAGTSGTSLTIGVSGVNISVDLATSHGTSGTVITTTAQQLATALNSYPVTANLLSVTAGTGGVGTGLVGTSGAALPLTGGVNGENYLVILEGGNLENNTLEDGDIISGYELFDTDDFQFSLILTADNDATVVEYLISMAETRQDSVVFVSPPESAVVNNAGNEATACVAFADTLPESTYVFVDGNWVQVYDIYNDVYRWVPANGNMAGLYVRTAQTRAPWIPFAGLNRGVLLNVVALPWNPKKTYRDILFNAAVNPIVSFPGFGPLLYGDKTFTIEPGPFDAINARFLMIYIEQAIAAAAKYTLFELNDAITRAQFVGLVNPFLADVEGGRGIYDYQVVCDSTNNTPEIIDAHGFEADIYLQPAKSIRNILLKFIATPTGVSFTEYIGQY
jgi:hypothetical protein